MPDTTTALPALTLADLQHCGADELLAQPTPASNYLEMQARLLSASETALADGEVSRAAALRLLAQVSSMLLVLDDRAAPFQAMIVTPAGRSMIPEDLTTTDIDLLADLAPTLQHVLLRARVADLVWHKERRKGGAFAHLAIEACRQPPIDSGEDSEVLKCRQRAIQVAHSTGKGGGALAGEIGGELLAAFWQAIDAYDQGAALRYLRPLQAEGKC